ncbi:TWiK family of potassium channels protein 7-like [Saccostrea cucullata]|uniref:TWiK family of potassium channels protein 7-like n=1 Tax=Saccostrea cuccullata TaxID=36930 RepID=UPI002ED33B57
MSESGRQRQGWTGSCYECRKKCCWFFKRLVVFCFSQIGIVCLVVGYALLGAAIFGALEEPKEELNRVLVKDIRNKTLHRLWWLNENLFVFERQNWTRAVEKVLQDFQIDVFMAVTIDGWDGREDNYTGVSEWSFTGALLYSVTVITTIGYGNITPKTTLGRFVTIVYAFIGIPLTMICLANVGHVLSISFKILYRRLVCKKRKKETNTTSDASSKYLFANPQNVKTEDDENETQFVLSDIETVSDTRVPVYVCFLLVIAYILLGTVLFSLWETWDPFTAGYFCFITLSTIGFGDVVPGHSLENWASPAKRVTCSLYLLFGLTLISMCFSLMVDHVREISRRFGQWIGLLQREGE